MGLTVSKKGEESAPEPVVEPKPHSTGKYTKMLRRLFIKNLASVEDLNVEIDYCMAYDDIEAVLSREDITLKRWMAAVKSKYYARTKRSLSGDDLVLLIKTMAIVSIKTLIEFHTLIKKKEFGEYNKDVYVEVFVTDEGPLALAAIAWVAKHYGTIKGISIRETPTDEQQRMVFTAAHIAKYNPMSEKFYEANKVTLNLYTAINASLNDDDGSIEDYLGKLFSKVDKKTDGSLEINEFAISNSIRETYAEYEAIK